MTGLRAAPEEDVEVLTFFNMRSPYCYLASKSMWRVFDEYRVRLVWRPLGGRTGRSSPERAKVKIPISRQDVARWCRRLGVPFVPPPATTEPTGAGAVSLLAEEQGVLRAYVVELFRAEWGHGVDIGDVDALVDVGRRVGLPEEAVRGAADDPARHARLEAHGREAAERNVVGVPTFVVGDQIFWGNDRLDFLEDHLRELRLSRR